MMENALFVEWSPKGVMGAPVDDEEPQWRQEMMVDGVPVDDGEYPIFGEESQWMIESPQ